MVDEVVLLPVYPARELPIEGVTSSLIVDKMTIANKQILDKEGVLNWVTGVAEARTGNGNSGNGWLLITAGAGDIDALVQPIKKIIESK
jgi:UDP-N-acetylmuramate--alanine ligase